MPFPDDELKRLKSKTERHPEMIEVWCVDLEALIARLEAAEKVASTPTECNCSQECDWHSDAIRAWRKAAGK